MMQKSKFKPTLTKSDLMHNLAKNQGHLARKDVELAINDLIKLMINTLSNGERIEVRGFGSFSLSYHHPRTGRNPKSGKLVNIPGKHVAHFKPGKEFRDRINKQ
jgi:integration host factor subunit beta